MQQKREKTLKLLFAGEKRLRSERKVWRFRSAYAVSHCLVW